MQTFSLGIIAGLAPGITRSFGVFQASGAQAAANEALAIYSGFDPVTRRWTVANMNFGLMPLIAGLLVSRFVGGSLGVNRILGRSRIPIRI